ncbi:MAG TPA: DUF302 domain-containing protein [Verrucomicrobiae bacterium]|nr:DUF302 domain-containing protein [Verrucomicrobiae bacterium]
MTTLRTIGYGRAVSAGARPFEEIVDRVKTLLKDEGFGVLCEIDVTAAMREKLGETFRPYRILGACNPQLAHTALSEEPQLGLLLPCNVVVQEERGRVVVSAVDAGAMLRVVGNAALDPVAVDANARLNRVLDRIAAE